VDSHGVMIVDSRNRELDGHVARSHLSLHIRKSNRTRTQPAARGTSVRGFEADRWITGRRYCGLVLLRKHARPQVCTYARRRRLLSQRRVLAGTIGYPVRWASFASRVGHVWLSLGRLANRATRATPIVCLGYARRRLTLE
jgi:hypothetical protein